MGVVIVHFDYLALDFVELFMKVSQPLAILSNFFFSNFLVNRTSYLFNETELEEVFDNVKAVLKDVLVLGVVIELAFLLRYSSLLSIIHKI